MGQGVVGEHHLQDERGAAEDDGVGAREGGQRPVAAELHGGEHQCRGARPPSRPNTVTSSVKTMPWQQVRQR